MFGAVKRQCALVDMLMCWCFDLLAAYCNCLASSSMIGGCHDRHGGGANSRFWKTGDTCF